MVLLDNIMSIYSIQFWIHHARILFFFFFSFNSSIYIQNNLHKRTRYWTGAWWVITVVFECIQKSRRKLKGKWNGSGGWRGAWGCCEGSSATLPHFYCLIYTASDDVRSGFVEICGEMRDRNLGTDLNSKMILRLVITNMNWLCGA